MANFRTWLMTIHSNDAEIQRRGRNVVVVSLGMIILAILLIPMTFISQANPLTGLITIAITQPLFISILALARRGAVDLGGVLLIGVSTVAILVNIRISPESAFIPFYLVLGMVLAGTVLRPYQIWFVLLATEVGLALAVLLPPQTFLRSPFALAASFGSAIILLFVALIGYLNARSSAMALQNAHAAEERARLASDKLEQANRELEERVQERTAALSDTLATQQRQADELRASLAEQQRLAEAIAELSLPIIPVRDDVLVAPLIGAIDGERADQLLAHVLEEVQQRRANLLVLDVTGVAVVDTHVAQVLLRVAEATRLLGARSMLVGIRPEVAQALVSLGVDLTVIETAATLQEGLVGVAVRGK